MTKIEGFVQEILERPSKYTDRNGRPKPSMWAVKVDEILYGTKNDKPECKEGDYVSFEASQNGKYWDMDFSTLKKATPAQTAPQPAAKAAAGQTSGSRWNDPKTQAAIQYQASRKDAIELVRMLLDKDLIDFGKAKGAQKIELVEIFVDNYTSRFNEDTTELSPPAHKNPVEAAYTEEVASVQKPGRKKKVAETESNNNDPTENDDFPFDLRH
jgi:hypothetical protein